MMRSSAGGVCTKTLTSALFRAPADSPVVSENLLFIELEVVPTPNSELLIKLNSKCGRVLRPPVCREKLIADNYQCPIVLIY